MTNDDFGLDACDHLRWCPAERDIGRGVGYGILGLTRRLNPRFGYLRSRCLALPSLHIVLLLETMYFACLYLNLASFLHFQNKEKHRKCVRAKRLEMDSSSFSKGLLQR